MEDDDFVLVDRNEPSSSPEVSPDLAETRTWLEPTAYTGDSSELQQHLNWLVPGTGEWIEETHEFQSWNSSSYGALWIKAIAGAGKSVLVARLVSLLQQNEAKGGTPVLYFFFRQIVLANHGPHALVRDWLAQLLSYSTELQGTLKDLRSRSHRVQDVGFNELWQILLDTLGSLDKAYCVIDALDELDFAYSDQFLPCLVALGQLAPDRIKLVMSSRPLPHIQKFLNDPTILSIRLDKAEVNRDIALFVDHRLRQAQSALSESVLAEIKQAITSRVHPSFLYARLLLNELLEKHNAEDLSEGSVRLSLLSVPATLEDLYTHMLADHSRKASIPQDRQYLILQLVTHATRPLRLLEIATVLGFHCGSDESQSGYSDIKAMTRASCGPLLEILEDETVSIIHHSFTEFLTDASRPTRVANTFPIIDSLDTHRLMGMICLEYLSAGVLSPDSPVDNGKNGIDLRMLQLNHPFIQYAAEKWFVHVSRLPEIDGELLTLLEAFMRPEGKTFQSWIAAVLKLKPVEIPTVSPLHAAAWSGMANYVEKLLSAGQDPNVLTERQKSPLTMAAQNGHTEVAKVLIQYNAAPDEPDYDGMKPLHYAARANHHAIVQVLMDQKVSPTTPKTRDPTPRFCGNAPSSVGQTPLQYACEAGAVESVRVMLPYLTEHDAQHAIKCSIQASRNNLVELLVAFPGLDFSTDFGGTCLLLAARKANYRALELFLQLGVDARYTPPMPKYFILDNQERLDESVLFALARYGHYRYKDSERASIEKCLDLLLAAGCNLSQTSYGKTALHEFVDGSLPGVEKLLEYGADVHAVDTKGNTPLHLFSIKKKSARTLDALMRYGARWDVIRSSDGKTPLHACLQSWGTDLDLLRPYITDWNVPDAQGNTPLHCLQTSSGSTSQKLVEMGADPNRRNFAGQTPLHICQQEEGTEGLIAAGADIEARDFQGRTVLLHHLEKCQPRDLDLLLRLGANLHAVDYLGNGALSHAIKNSDSVKIWRTLLEAGADPRHLNHRGDTLLHCLMENSLGSFNYHATREFFDILVHEYHIDPTAQNNEGRTILHFRCAVKPAYLIQRTLNEDNLIEWLEPSSIQALLEKKDHQGRRAIHDAAGTSEYLVAWLADKGATLTASTYDGQNVLHLAATSKQSNIMGLLLERLQVADRLRLVNQQDRDGRTPLFYACISGDFQSVSLLLQAGADVKTRDKKQETPLHACTHIKPQDKNENQNSRSGIRTARTLEGVPRIQAIIQALESAGADVLAQDNGGRTPLQLAVDHNSEEIVAALEESTREKLLQTGSHQTDEPGLSLLLARHRSATSIVDSITAKSEYNMIDTCHSLLEHGAYNAIRALAGRGWKLSAIGENSYNSKDFLQDLSKLGLTELLEDLGKMREGTEWINGMTMKPDNLGTKITPFLVLAAQRETPSMDLLRVMVETFHADVNIQVYKDELIKGKHQAIATQSPLRTLAQGDHWWHSEGLRYLLQHGADPNLCDGDHRSALHIAVTGGYRKVHIIRILLEHGASPNLVDGEGNTPLGLAAGNAEIVRLLLAHGADINLGSTPLLFTAITKQDVDTVRIILEAGADCNKPFTEGPVHDSDKRPGKASVRNPLHIAEEEEYYMTSGPRREEADREQMLLCRPLHYACHARFNIVPDRNKAVAIVKLLVAGGADLTLPVDIYESTGILIHDVIYQWGVLEPLLAIPELNLEQRDGEGRTLFLAACSPQRVDAYPWNWNRGVRISSSSPITRSGVIRQLYEMGADITATDKNGNTALHLFLTAVSTAISQPGQNKSSTSAVTEMITFLLDQVPGMIHQRNHDGYTPFHIASQHRVIDSFDLLIDRGSDFQEPDPLGNTLLHHLASALTLKPRKQGPTPEFTAFTTFLTRGLDINACNHAGETPLFKYISAYQCEKELYKHRSLIEDLESLGADIQTKNSVGETLLHVVARSSCAHGFRARCRMGIYRYEEAEACDAFKFLLEKGLDPFWEDEGRRSAVDVAAAYGKGEILALFQKG